MAVNPETGIDPEVDRFAVWQESQQRYTKLSPPAKWPRSDGGQIVGANPDFKYYKFVTVDRPDVDHRYTIDTASAKVNFDPEPADGLPKGEYKDSHTIVKLPVEDLKAQVDTEFQRQVQLAFPTINTPSLLIEAADAVTRKQDGATLTSDQQAVLTAINASGDAVAQLRARKAALYAAIDADEDYDIEAGWTIA